MPSRKPRRFTAKMPPDVKSSITALKRWRRFRNSASAATGAATFAMSHFPLPQRIAVSILGAVGMYIVPTHSSVEEATHYVGRMICKESQTNRNLKKFLREYKYIYVDQKGSLIGTDRKSILKIGRIRLETKKILDFGY